MNVHHCTDAELLEALYGLREPGAHVNSCAGCRRRWEALVDRRDLLRRQDASDVSPAFLAAQQARIRERMDGSHPALWGFPVAPAAVAALLVLIAVILLRPNPQPEPAYARGSAAEGQFYLEIYQQVVAEEPRGAAPIRGLFEDKHKP